MVGDVNAYGLNLVLHNPKPKLAAKPPAPKALLAPPPLAATDATSFAPTASTFIVLGD